MAAVLIGINRDDLPEDAKILEQYRIACILNVDLNNAKAELEKMVKKFQASCQHDFEALKQLRQGDEAYVGEVCRKCKFFVPRNAGPPWKICEKCGGEMEFVARTPQHPRLSFVYTCKDCGHEHSYAHK